MSLSGQRFTPRSAVLAVFAWLPFPSLALGMLQGTIDRQEGNSFRVNVEIVGDDVEVHQARVLLDLTAHEGAPTGTCHDPIVDPTAGLIHIQCEFSSAENVIPLVLHLQSGNLTIEGRFAVMTGATLVEPPTWTSGWKIIRPSLGVAGDTPRRATDPLVTLRGDTYGPTLIGMPLSSIAGQIAPRFTQDPQVVAAAIYRLNPGSFVDDQPLEVRAGSTLKLPTAGDVAAVTADELTNVRRAHKAEVTSDVPETDSDARLQPWYEKPPNQKAAGYLVAFLLAFYALVRVLRGLILGITMACHRARAKVSDLFYKRTAPTAPLVTSSLPRYERQLPGSPGQRARLVQSTPAPDPVATELRKQLAIEPGRVDIRVKLAVRLHELGDGALFTEIAVPLRSQLPPKGWERIRRMGKSLRPCEEAFAEDQEDGPPQVQHIRIEAEF